MDYEFFSDFTFRIAEIAVFNVVVVYICCSFLFITMLDLVLLNCVFVCVRLILCNLWHFSMWLKYCTAYFIVRLPCLFFFAVSDAMIRHTRSVQAPVCVNQCLTAPWIIATMVTVLSLMVRSFATVTRVGRQLIAM